MTFENLISLGGRMAFVESMRLSETGGGGFGCGGLDGGGFGGGGFG